MSAKTIGRCGHWLDLAAPVLVVLALASFALGGYCATQNLPLDGLVCDANGSAFLIAILANHHSRNH